MQQVFDYLIDTLHKESLKSANHKETFDNVYSDSDIFSIWFKLQSSILAHELALQARVTSVCKNKSCLNFHKDQIAIKQTLSLYVPI
jgi:hypothetical protein